MTPVQSNHRLQTANGLAPEPVRAQASAREDLYTASAPDPAPVPNANSLLRAPHTAHIAPATRASSLPEWGVPALASLGAGLGVWACLPVVFQLMERAAVLQFGDLAVQQAEAAGDPSEIYRTFQFVGAAAAAAATFFAMRTDR